MTRQYESDVWYSSPRDRELSEAMGRIIATLPPARGSLVVPPRWWQPPGVTDEEMDTAIARGLWRWERE